MHAFKADGDFPAAWPFANVLAGWKQGVPVTHPLDNFQDQKSSNGKEKTNKQKTFCQMITWTPASSKTSICEREKL